MCMFFFCTPPRRRGEGCTRVLRPIAKKQNSRSCPERLFCWLSTTILLQLHDCFVIRGYRVKVGSTVYRCTRTLDEFQGLDMFVRFYLFLLVIIDLTKALNTYSSQ